MVNETNEFDDLGIDEAAPDQEYSDDKKTESMVSAGAQGEVYDWSKAPEGTKAPPRIDLDGKTVTIEKAEIVLPNSNKPWITAKNNKQIFYKYCMFCLHYDIDGQREYVSGVRVFKKDDGKYSHPTIKNDDKTQSGRLKLAYATLKEKSINDVSLKEFMAFLNGKPKATIKVEDVENPETGATVKKNLPGKFL